jgi:hydrogenase maturation protease
VTEDGTSAEAVLVIGYGNEGRGDDGIGPRVAEAIASANYPGVRVVTVAQLLPELAAELAAARLAVFVDARADSAPAGVAATRITAHETTDWSTHTADPRALLALSGAVYGCHPEAWWVTVPGQYFGFGEVLSPFALENVRRAIHRIEALLHSKSHVV